MTLQELPGTFVGGAIRVVRLPLDGAFRVASFAGRGEPAKLAVDRADATLRVTLAGILHDDSMLEDAQNRLSAATARTDAAGLKEEAELRARRADAEAERKKQEAETRRKKAAAETKRKREDAKRKRESVKKSATKTAEQRKKKAEKDAQDNKKTAEESDKRASLKQLEAKSEALSLREAAVTAADEARRLDRETAAVKSSRKNGR